MKQLRRLIRRIEINLPNVLLIFLVNFENRIRKSGSHILFDGKRQMYLIKDKQYALYFPRKPRVLLYTHGLSARLNYLYEAYGLNKINLTQVELFVDCGANVGELSLIVKHRHDLRILAVEPEKKEFACLEKNIVGNNVNLVNGVLWKEDGIIQLHSKPNSGDSSVIISETGLPTFEVSSYRLDKLIMRLGFESLVSILKVEAEGAEPEVIDGAKEHLVYCKYVTFDGGAERGIDKLTTFEVNGQILKKSNFEKIYSSATRDIELWKNLDY
jgi:FkbM family methyltransferase